MRRAPASLVAFALISALAGCKAPPREDRKPPPAAAQAIEGPRDYDAHVAALTKKVGSRFTIVVEAPFVVLGDEAPERVRSRAERTVQWATTKLKQDYFAKDPVAIIDIYLFKDAESYEDHALAFFGARPSTPYGYYSSENKALLMNISTGEGTLVHEMVHPFIESNLPGCPAWFNEGLASLYERPGEVNDHIYGDTNWRLPPLQRSIRAHEVPAFDALLATTDGEFYGEERGVNYAEARYLLYYLQERDLLLPYYKELAATRATDPTGVGSLRKILGDEDLAAFQKRWERFILKLRFEG